MVSAKIIKTSELVDSQSLVIVKTVVVDLEQNSKVTLLADYYSIEMPSNHIQEPLKLSLLGKKVGDTYEEKAGSTKVILTTIKEIYNLVEGERVGESVPAPEPVAPEPVEVVDTSKTVG